MRMTRTTRRVLEAFLADATGDHYGYDIMLGAGIKSGSLYPILARLEEAGWVESEWETVEPSAEGRPRRRYYRLTPSGTAFAVDATQPRSPRVSAVGLIPKSAR